MDDGARLVKQNALVIRKNENERKEKNKNKNKSSCIFIEPKSTGKKLIIEPIKPRVFWFFF